MASGIPRVATETTISGESGASSAASSRPACAEKPTPRSTVMSERDHQVVGERDQREVDLLRADRGTVGGEGMHGPDSRPTPAAWQGRTCGVAVR